MILFFPAQQNVTLVQPSGYIVIFHLKFTASVNITSSYLHFQPITARDSCGSNFSYEVRARQSHGNTYNAGIWRSVIPVELLDNGARVMLNSEEDEATIQSMNSVGVATHLPRTIIRVPPSACKSFSISGL